MVRNAIRKLARNGAAALVLAAASIGPAWGQDASSLPAVQDVDERIDRALGALDDAAPPRLFLAAPPTPPAAESGQPFKQQPLNAQQDHTR